MIEVRDVNSQDQLFLTKTLLFGDVEIGVNNIIKFGYGIPGFESLTKFVILDLKDYYPFRILQSIEESDIAILILNVRALRVCNRIEIPYRNIEKIKAKSVNQIDIYVILKTDTKSKQLLANLRAPLLVNTGEKIGEQVILDNDSLEVEYALGKELVDLNSFSGSNT